MNWTGGTLSRSRNANAIAKASLSNIQKNYFAKARAKAQNRQHKSPPQIQYFDLGEWKPGSNVCDDRPSDPVKGSTSRQKTLDQYQNVQGVVKKLQSLRPKNEGKKRKRSVINDAEGYVLPSGIPVPPISPTIIRSHRSSSPSPTRIVPTEERVGRRLRTSTWSTSDELYPLAALDSVEAKRLRLLQQSDWAGIERQKCLSKPVKMKFTDAEDRDLIGRRRPLKGSATQNRWNVQGSEQMKIPLMAPCDDRGENWSPDEMSIRIGSTAASKGPVVDEMLDCYYTPEIANRSTRPVQTSKNNDTEYILNPRHRTPEITDPLGLRRQTSEPFRSLFSPEEVEQSGVAQLIEASTIADEDSPSFTGDKLQLPEDYRFSESEPGFHFVFEQSPQPRGWTSELDHGSDPIVFDSAFTDEKPQGSALDQRAHPEYGNVLEDQISEYPPIENAMASTSPLSIATSRFLQELEDQSFRASGREFFTRDVANRVAASRAHPTVNKNSAEEKQHSKAEQGPKVSGRREDVQDKENIEPDEDQDEIWRDFITTPNRANTQSSQPEGTDIPHTTAIASQQNEQPSGQIIRRSDVQKTPPSPQDDEQIWRKFIFSSPNPNNEWLIEEASPEECPVPNNQASTVYDPARTQPSMVAEAATSPVKQNPHLLDEMLDDSSPVLDDASHYAHAATSSTGSPNTTEDVSIMAPPNLYPSSSSPTQQTSILTTSSPASHNTRNHQATTTPSSLLAQASPSSSSFPSSRPPIPAANPPPNSKRGKITFRKPTRYIGDTGPSEVVHHLGRKIGRRTRKETHKDDNVNTDEGKGKGKVKGKENGKGKKTRSRTLAEAVERAKRQMEKNATRTGSKVRLTRKESRDESDETETETDEIIDD